MLQTLRARWLAWMAIPLTIRWAIILWFALIVSVSVRVLVSKPTSQTVLPIYLLGAERWAQSENLYTPVIGMDLFRNPPIVAIGFVPFLHIPARPAGVVVRVASVLLFLAGLRRVQRELLPELTPSQIGWFYMMPLLLVLPSFNNGQLNMLIAAVVLHGLAAVNRANWWEAAFWFSVAGWVKVYPFAVGMLVMLIVPRQFGWRFIALGVLGFLLPFLAQRPEYVLEQYANYWHYLGLDDRTYADLARVPRDWTTLPRMWLDLVPKPQITKAVSLAMAMLFAGLVFFRKQCPRADRFLFAFILGSTWMTVFGPATEVPTYTLIASITPLILLGYIRQPKWLLALAWIGYVLNTATILRAMFPSDWKFNVLGPQALGTLLMVLVTLRYRNHPAEVRQKEVTPTDAENVRN